MTIVLPDYAALEAEKQRIIEHLGGPAQLLTYMDSNGVLTSKELPPKHTKVLADFRNKNRGIVVVKYADCECWEETPGVRNPPEKWAALPNIE
jgi:hypothetical protein